MPAVERCPYCNCYRPRDSSDRALYHCYEEGRMISSEDARNEARMDEIIRTGECICSIPKNEHTGYCDTPWYCYCPCQKCMDSKFQWAQKERLENPRSKFFAGGRIGGDVLSKGESLRRRKFTRGNMNTLKKKTR